MRKRNVRRARANAKRRSPTHTKWDEMDGFLEDTLLNNTVAGERLTGREMQILQSILAGQTNKQIARAFCRSRRTIEYHRHRLIQKLNAHSAAELVRGAIAMGLAGQTVRRV